jgi:membrane fusion protein (multidrug efflux system)
MATYADRNEAGEERAAGLTRPARRWRRWALMLVVPAALAAVGTYAYVFSGRYAGTDNAYVKADKIPISADVAGRVVQVAVRENERVVAGQILFRLDDAPYRIAVERARAELANARLQVESMRATYRQKVADLQAVRDTLAYREKELTRQRELFAAKVTSGTKLDEAAHEVDAARQQVASVQQQLAQILASLGGDPNLAVDAHPLALRAKAQLDQAALDLAHTVVAAPGAGFPSKVDQLQVGGYLNAGAPALVLMSSERVWVEANFKETDLTHLRPGQEATVTVDTYPDRVFRAHVVSIGSGTGAEFAVLPPQNATGNWVKVVQRIPVRLVIETAAGDPTLRAGMSVAVEVDTQHRGKLLVTLEEALDGLRGAMAATRNGR